MTLFRGSRILTASLATRCASARLGHGRGPGMFLSWGARGWGRPNHRRAWTFAVVLAALSATPPAFAQSTDTTQTPPAHPKKKKPKTAPAASATATASDTAAASPAPTPPDTTPSDSAGANPPPPPPPAATVPPPPPPENYDITNTTEDPNKRYIFIGLRYRGTIVPKFIQNIFVDEGKTIYSNTFGAEVDIRKGGQSMIPWIQYTDYNTGDILFLQKNPSQESDPAANYSVVNSSLKAVYIGIDELWSVPAAPHLDFEFGFGVGLGFVFGHLQNNWVYQNNNGPLAASTGVHYAECTQATTNNLSCTTAGHTNATVAKIGGYTEPNWFNGGSVPVVFPHVAAPQLSLRYKPIKQLETRISIGFSLTGFWFGISANYGLEQKEPPGASHLATHEVRLRDTL